jgi:hypothetical protein
MDELDMLALSALLVSTGSIVLGLLLRRVMSR